MEQLLQQLNQYWQPVIEFFAFDTALLSEPDMIVRLVLQFVLLMCSAFFSSSETALFSLSRLDLQQLRREQNPRSETIHELLDQPRKLIISILSGNELVNIAAAANMTSILISLYQPDKVVLINLLVMVPLLLTPVPPPGPPRRIEMVCSPLPPRRISPPAPSATVQGAA